MLFDNRTFQVKTINANLSELKVGDRIVVNLYKPLEKIEPVTVKAKEVIIS